MDTIDAAMICHTVYFYSVSNYVNPRVIAGPTWSFWVHAGVTILANSIIRGLFTVRIYRMSQFNMAATLWIMATSLACLIAGYIAISKGSHLSTFAELDEILAAIYVTFISGAVSDISVAIILCILLHKSKTKFSKTNSLIKVLRLYTINTSFIVAIDDLVILITKCVTPNNLVFMAFYFCLGKLYLNAYLATLNARQKLRNKSNKPTTVHLSDMGFGTSISTGSDSDGLPIHSAMNPNFVEISVETVVDNKH
ncbi:hypothetical protein VKT23_016928 [Stygiomarasmius scandens]|uniref:DUF6534 domain-containing protein n=1 Tax=Marasmiellus scandens TaxID=2682957 RepID=A0ABR1ITH4_9AGAR